MVGAAAAAPAPLFSEATRGGRVWFSAVTVAGLVPGDPDELFSVFADPARAAGAGVFTNVRSCREVARGQPRLSHQRHVLQRVDVEQVARLQVLRLALDAPMTVRLDCNHTLRQVHLQLLKGNALMRRFEGQYHVLPWDATERTPPALPAGLAEALGPEAARQLAAKLAAMAADRPSSGTQAPRQPSKLAKQPQGRQPGGKPQQSLVILHQKLHPGVRPPPGLGGYVRGQVLREFERMLRDLHSASQKLPIGPRPTLQSLGDWLRSLPMPNLGL